MKYSIVIGIDPSSQAHGHGIAIYHNGKLQVCGRATTIDIVTSYVKKNSNVIFSIENVAANKFIYGGNDQKTKKKQGKVGMDVGKVQQAQIELMRWMDFYGAPYILFSPQGGNWAEERHKPQFERLTGWTGRSNKDGRSAAFFGYLALNSKQIK